MDTGFGPGEWLGLLQRQIRIILATAATVFALSALAILGITPVYTATALVMLAPDDQGLLAMDARLDVRDADNARVDGEVELAQSDAVLLMVIDRERLTDDAEFAPRDGWPTRLLVSLSLRAPSQRDAETQRLQTLDRFAATVSAQRRGLTFLMAINARSADPAKAARLANALARAYIDSQLAAKLDSMARAQALLSAQLAAGDDAATGLTAPQRDELLALAQQLRTQSALQLPDSRVVSDALRPSAPSWPNLRLLLLLALAASLGLGLAIAWLYERLIGAVMSEEQLAAIAGTKLAWALPTRRAQPRETSLADAIMRAPLSAYAEAIRKIRTGIDQSLAGTGRSPATFATCIAVTSTDPGEGKTTLALSLARSYAQSGRRTILIDCDLRHPALHLQLGLEPSDELTRALQSDDPAVTLQAALVRDGQTGLLTLVGSTNSETATDQLITSQNFDRLIAAAALAFDVVLLDTPPLSQAVDGLYLARKANAVVMAVKWAATARSDLRRALLSLEPALAAGPLLIPVLTQQDPPHSLRSWRSRRYRH